MTSLSKSHRSSAEGVEVDREAASGGRSGGDGSAGGDGGDGGEIGEEEDMTINAMDDLELQPLLISGENDEFHKSYELI